MDYLEKNLKKMRLRKVDEASRAAFWNVWWKHFRANSYVCQESVLDGFGKLQPLMEPTENQPEETIGSADESEQSGDSTANLAVAMEAPHTHRPKEDTPEDIKRRIQALKIKGPSSQQRLAFVEELQEFDLQNGQIWSNQSCSK